MLTGTVPPTPEPDKCRMYLKDLAPLTVDVLRQVACTTADELANTVLQKLGDATADHQASGSGHEAIRRRIYDVINVLTAAGIAQRDGKTLSWCGMHPGIEARDDWLRATQILQARSKVRDEKLAQLVLYKLLLARNWNRTRPQASASLPGLLIARSGGRGELVVTHSADASRLQLTAGDATLQFFGTLDILRGVGLTKAAGRELLLHMPEEVRPGAQRIIEQVCVE